MTTVRRRLDPKKSLKLSDEAKARYDALPDEAIDYSETPDLGDVDWTASNVDMPCAKLTVTMRPEENIIGFFNDANSKDYAGRMAAVLTAYARAHQTK